MIKLNLSENFISRIWEDKSNYSDLKTTDGHSVEVIDFGIPNYDAGPDYKNAKIKIAGILYKGSVEIHRSLKDWYLHKHKRDNKYNDLILHVVFYANDPGELFNNPVVKKARSIPTLILSEFLSRSVHEIWKEVINNPTVNFKLPCYPQNKIAAQSEKTDWIKKLGIERLNYKYSRIQDRLTEISETGIEKIYWDQVLFEFICEALGYSKNKEQFLKLAEKIEVSEIRKMNLNRDEIDSLIFGQSGFLNDLKFRNQYISAIKDSWDKLRLRFKKEIMNKSEWNFFRLRPPNFPTLRLAYAAGLMYEILNKNLFKNIIGIFEKSENINIDLENLFYKIDVSDYWKNHYDFGKESKSRNTPIGKERITAVISNVILPLAYFYSIKFEMGNLNNRINYFYQTTKQKSGSNEVIRVMEKQLDVKVNTFSDEQGLIHLHNFYCTHGKCSKCEIGKLVFENETVTEPLRIILY